MVLAYIDYSQQEFIIAAALSGDPEMKAAYSTVDPYLAFAKQQEQCHWKLQNQLTKLQEIFLKLVYWAFNTEWGQIV
jgi:hypothetical protein